MTELRELDFLYDGDCGFCMRSLALLRRLDRGGAIRARALQEPGAVEEFGVTPEQALDTAWAKTATERFSGAAAINAAAAAALGTSLPLRLYRLRSVGWVQDRVYAWVSRNRHRLPGGTSACRVERP